MVKIRGAIVVNTDRCKGCGLCVEACPKEVIALAKKVNVNKVVFDRSGYLYHGRVKALAEAARENGLEF